MACGNAQPKHVLYAMRQCSMLICQYLHDEYSGRVSHSSPGMLWNELVATYHFKLRCLRCRSVWCVAVVVLFHLATFSGRYRWPLVHSCSRWWSTTTAASDRSLPAQHQITHECHLLFITNIELVTSLLCHLFVVSRRVLRQLPAFCILILRNKYNCLPSLRHTPCQNTYSSRYKYQWQLIGID